MFVPCRNWGKTDNSSRPATNSDSAAVMFDESENQNNQITIMAKVITVYCEGEKSSVRKILLEISARRKVPNF